MQARKQARKQERKEEWEREQEREGGGRCSCEESSGCGWGSITHRTHGACGSDP